MRKADSFKIAGPLNPQCVISTGPSDFNLDLEFGYELALLIDPLIDSRLSF